VATRVAEDIRSVNPDLQLCHTTIGMSAFSTIEMSPACSFTTPMKKAWS